MSAPSPRPRPGTLWLPTRRQFLAGAAATAFLAACGDDDAVDTGSGGDGAPDSDPVLSVLRFFGPFFAAGSVARVPFGLSDDDGLLPAADSPAELPVRVVLEGETVAEGITASLHTDGLPRPYYAFTFEPEAPGFYDFTLDVEGSEVISQLQVVAADDPTLDGFVGPGDAMPAVPTPTVDEPMGVTPICTREPICDLHGVSYDQVVGTAPSVLMVSTPAFCQVAVCGPVLDLLLDIVPEFPDVRFVHAEVFTNPADNSVPPVPDDFAPVVRALGLPFEPAMYLVGADGVVAERLDYVFDGEEMHTAIARLVG